MLNTPRKTKILATVGPASDTAEVVEQLIAAGADGFRLNFSHGNSEYFRPLVALIRSVSEKLERPIAIVQDLQGPKIRVGTFKDNQPVHLKPGARFNLTIEDLEGDEKRVSTTYKDLPKDVRPGDRLLLDDGAIELKTLNVTATDVETEVIVGGWLKPKKGINLPGVRVSAPSLTEKDLRDARFGADLQVDYIALSFVRAAADVSRLRDLLNDIGHQEIKIIAKIEKPEAIDNLVEILDVSDGIMVARGDLGVELPAEKVPLLQKMIIERANKMEKLVITATQMLESMVQNARPTRAEASDVANAIIDGTDVVMLSQETAVGLYPVKAVKTMASIAHYTESEEKLFEYTEKIRPDRLTNFTHAIVHSARAAAEVMSAKAILVFTQSGMTAHLAACQRPKSPIYAFTPNRRTYQQLALVWGVTPILFESLPSTDAMIKRGEELLQEEKFVDKGDVVVIISGTNPIRGATNMMKMKRIGDAT